MPVKSFCSLFSFFLSTVHFIPIVFWNYINFMKNSYRVSFMYFSFSFSPSSFSSVFLLLPFFFIIYQSFIIIFTVFIQFYTRKIWLYSLPLLLPLFVGLVEHIGLLLWKGWSLHLQYFSFVNLLLEDYLYPEYLALSRKYYSMSYGLVVKIAECTKQYYGHKRGRKK